MGISKLNPSAGGIPFGDTAGRPTGATGKLYSNGETARLELYTANGSWENIVQEVPGVASITGNYSQATDSGTITISGTNFVSGAIASAIGTNGVEISASSTTYNSLVQLSAVFTGLSNSNEPYDIKVTNPSNLFGLLPDALYINASPVWTTASGSLGTFTEQASVSVSATATDSDSTITYSLASGSSLPSGLTLNSSTGSISGNLPNISSSTTYTFTINASDGLNAIPRTFTITSNPYAMVTSGLQVFWDATNASSYSGSGTSIYNIAQGGSTHTGTLNDGVSFGGSGQSAYLQFDGVNDDITNSSYTAPTSGVGTISIWVYPLSHINSGQNYVATVGTPATGQARAITWIGSTGNWGFVGYGSSPQDQTNIAPVTLNAWQQITLVFNGNDIDYYVGTTKYSYTKSLSNPSSSSTIIGQSMWSATGESSNVRIGSVAIYNTALTSTDVTNNYNAFRERYGL